jgi:hypothetical protein
MTEAQMERALQFGHIPPYVLYIGGCTLLPDRYRRIPVVRW